MVWFDEYYIGKLLPAIQILWKLFFKTPIPSPKFAPLHQKNFPAL